MSGKSLVGKGSGVVGPRYAAIDPATGEDIRKLSVYEQYQHHKKQTRIHERSTQRLIEQTMSEQLRQEYLRAKYPALQSAWDAYQVTLRMVDKHDTDESRGAPIEDDAEDCCEDFSYSDDQMMRALAGYRALPPASNDTPESA